MKKQMKYIVIKVNFDKYLNNYIFLFRILNDCVVNYLYLIICVVDTYHYKLHYIHAIWINHILINRHKSASYRRELCAYLCKKERDRGERKTKEQKMREIYHQGL